MNISIPVEIITKKLSPNKQNSIFYAKVSIGNREYVLTTSGYYSFNLNLKENITISLYDNSDNALKTLISTLTDTKIKKLDEDRKNEPLQIHHQSIKGNNR